MINLEQYLVAVDNYEFSGDKKCIELLDNLLQNFIAALHKSNLRSTGEYIDLKGCSWVLHERYYMEDDLKLQWTFYHTKYRIMKNCIELIKKEMAREGKENNCETNIKVTEW